ncbi:hypothetical protein PVAG01_10565 [Phlyctema vagabunda]|uniref:Uncharacterized protein n=1 Tax=Phlyctema vagabunda TaxID=108571 RepID=A0ABR4P2M3_9HELO
MDIVTCYCLKCEEQLGRFNNSWNGIGKTYFSPADAAYAVLGALGLEAIGEFRAAEPGTRIEKSFLQDLACRKCKTVVGMRCESAPKGSFLKRDQLILRLKTMTVLSEKTGLRTAPVVLKTYSLIDSSTSKSARRLSGPQPATEDNISHTKHSVNVRVKDIDRRELTKSIEWAEDALNTQRKDIDRIDGAVGRIERDMRLFKEFMSDVRKELDAIHQPSASTNQEIVNLQQDIRQIRQGLAQVEQVSSRAELEPFELPKEHIQRISQTATEVGSLKLELEAMRTRLEQVESITREAVQGPDETQTIGAENEVAMTMEEFESRRKAAIELADDVHEQGEKEMATKLITRTFGKRKISELQHGAAELSTSSPQSKRRNSNQTADPSGTGQIKRLMQESSPNVHQIVEPQARSSASRHRKVVLGADSTPKRPLEHESGQVDGRSTRSKKSDEMQSQVQQTGRRSTRATEIIDPNNEEERLNSRKVSQHPVRTGRGRKVILPSTQHEGRDSQDKRRRMEAKEALAKETLERFV